MKICTCENCRFTFRYPLLPLACPDCGKKDAVRPATEKELEDYYKMHFDYAIEDSPTAFRFFDHLPELKVMVYDRPLNRECEFPGLNYRRCPDWEQIREIVV